MVFEENISPDTKVCELDSDNDTINLVQALKDCS